MDIILYMQSLVTQLGHHLTLRVWGGWGGSYMLSYPAALGISEACVCTE